MGMPVEIESNRGLIAGEVEKLGGELLDIHFRRVGQKSTITFVVDKPGGITLDECVTVNRALSALFDLLTEGPNGEPGEGLISGSYYLEVNSPGLDRPLRTQRDFERAKGQTVKVFYRDETGTKSLDYTGEILKIEDGAVHFMRVHDSKIQWIKLESITKAVREITFKK
jgi:ribosome maturation factor RimP